VNGPEFAKYEVEELWLSASLFFIPIIRDFLKHIPAMMANKIKSMKTMMMAPIIP